MGSGNAVLIMFIVAVVVLTYSLAVYHLLKLVLWPKETRLCYDCAERGQYIKCKRVPAQDTESFQVWECPQCLSTHIVRINNL